MQENESIIVLRCKLRNKHSVTRNNCSASLVMPSSYASDGIFNPHLTAITESYFLTTYSFGLYTIDIYTRGDEKYADKCYKILISARCYLNVALINFILLLLLFFFFFLELTEIKMLEI